MSFDFFAVLILQIIKRLLYKLAKLTKYKAMLFLLKEIPW